MNESMNGQLPDAEMQRTGPERRKLCCDQVAWITAALDRFAKVARNRNSFSERDLKAAKLAALLEIMDVTGCEFEDDLARRSAISEFPELCPDRSVINRAIGA